SQAGFVRLRLHNLPGLRSPIPASQHYRLASPVFLSTPSTSSARFSIAPVKLPSPNRFSLTPIFSLKTHIAASTSDKTLQRHLKSTSSERLS
ncbi:hypothetical protein, partial [Paraburkholderia humisilvae]|uniref:hypothetical protein n=1 Tax=Paraburkholderia humisilvae TaxID=627669 RepID=UPI0035E9B504